MMNKILQGDALNVLKTLPEKSINMIMTSPPYWALRDYGVEGQLGLEPTFVEYISKLCDIFDEVKRVLRDDGTCWVNLGDTYMNNSSYSSKGRQGYEQKEGMINKSGLPIKCLTMIPERFALEMINRGWILRNKIIWHKNNAMPSSVLDRFSNKYEIVYMFSKSKKYYFNIDNVRVPFKTDEKRPDGITRNRDKDYQGKYNTKEGTKRRIMEDGANVFGKRRPPQSEGDYIRNSKGKNPGDVWTLNLQPFPEAHFAVYPEKICETPIKAGCTEGGIVLDPFFGAGTTGLVALKQNKKFLGIELNPEYIKIAMKRLKPFMEQSKL